MRHILLLCCVLSLIGCQHFRQAKQQSQLLDSVAEINGRVDYQSNSDGGELVVAVLSRNDNTFSIENQKLLDSNGQFKFYLKPGTYYVAVYQDSNHNLTYDDNETGVAYVDSVGMLQAITLTDKAKYKTKPTPFAKPVKKGYAVQYSDNYNINNIGKLANLEHAMFDAHNVDMGFWRPLDFLAQVESGLFMLSPYNAKKEPLILVHGMMGNPREFSALVAALEDSNYQVWVLYYPSGVGLHLVKDYLLESIEVMQKRYGFDAVSVLAHSMGGLITRGYALSHQGHAGNYKINHFITVNSPLLGMQSARKGVESSPLVINSWRDVATNSDYVNQLHTQTLQPEINYALVFSYQDGASDDGVVALSSQIPLNIQREANKMMGFNASHAGVLKEPKFIHFIMSTLSNSASAN